MASMGDDGEEQLTPAPSAGTGGDDIDKFIASLRSLADDIISDSKCRCPNHEYITKYIEDYLRQNINNFVEAKINSDEFQEFIRTWKEYNTYKSTIHDSICAEPGTINTKMIEEVAYTAHYSYLEKQIAKTNVKIENLKTIVEKNRAYQNKIIAELSD